MNFGTTGTLDRTSKVERFKGFQRQDLATLKQLFRLNRARTHYTSLGGPLDIAREEAAVNQKDVKTPFGITTSWRRYPECPCEEHERMM
ncbi:hypothetical protein RRG08_028109 [Elysia crispata]|uniref:Uncharacterized protein n=1 Tax=Elysia crispata TaxID=231223 RepID=A0AAE1DRR9_9GAST|nr:hypothetical protein RRG08_028109 [Elysia crispata]